MTAAHKPAGATLSGREIALMRRQAMTQHGKAGLNKLAIATFVSPARAATTATRSASMPSAHIRPGSHAASTPQHQPASAPPVAPKRAALERRQALSRMGKSALTGAAKPQNAEPARHGRTKPVPSRPGQAAAAAHDCGCATPSSKNDAQTCACQTLAGHSGGHADPSVTHASNDAPRREVQPVGKALARARRVALSQDGKSGIKRVEQATRIAASLPGQDWQMAITKGASGRQVAMQHRKVRALMGTCNTNRATTRPSAHVRVRPAFMETPPKVEEAHTLSGTAVTGTMVERSRKVTGNEPGSCRTITGTEYIGFEQYGEICDIKVEPGPLKVRSSQTARDLTVTGTEVGYARSMTGNEAGACRAVTGIDYLPANMYDKFCPTRAPAGPVKVVSEATPKGKTISGTLVGRPSQVTGGEMGADRAITGTSYGRLSADTAPPKVGMTHTHAALPLTGTTVGRDSKVTGDEPGSCRNVTGSQYLSAEHFKDFCRSEVPAPARRMSVMSTPGGQTMTGSDVGRSHHVTGDEAGSCRAVTGNQYFNAKDFGALCNTGGPRKVARIETRGGAGMSGTEIASSPKMSGDEAGRCSPVTGIDYFSADQSAALCGPNAPRIKPVSKVGVDLTLNGKQVTGSAFGRSEQVTGDEYGACSPISGSSYIGRGQYQTFCAPESLQAQSARVRDRASIPATMVSGDRPGAGGRTMTGDERGTCLTVTGAPYIGADNRASSCATRPDTANRFLSRQRPPEQEKPAAPTDFSIRSPARVAWDSERDARSDTGSVTGTAYSAVDRITGPGNKAGGLITGTPEFRHHDFAPGARRGTPRDADAQGDQARIDLTKIAKAQRLSGEAQIHERVTGDAWKAQSRVSGTEGRSSLMRNPSQRGNPRGTVMDARSQPEAEKPPAAANLVTGSSGNSGRGPLVTVSGGARA